MRKKLLGSYFVFIMTLLKFSSFGFCVGSGGYENQVPSARAMGRANSVAATVDDASAVSFNPARLTSIKGTDMSLGVTVQTIESEYDNQAGTTQSSDHPTSFTPNFHIGSTFGLDKFAFGLGINVPYGVDTKWSETGPLRYIATESNLTIIDVNPAMAYQINPNISVGAGLDFYRVDEVELNNRVNVDAFNQSQGGSAGSPDGNQTVSGDGDDIGFNLGIAANLVDRHFFGLSYRSGANIEVEGSLKLSGLSNEMAANFGGTNYETSAKAKIPVPKQVQLGYGFKIKDGFLIELDGEWNEWSSFKDQNVKFGETDPNRLGVLNAGNPAPKNWKNSWSVGLGTEYLVNDKLSLRGGYGFIDSPVPNETFEASIPDSDMHMFTIGGGYKFNPVRLDLAIQYFKLNERKIDNTVGIYNASNGNGTYNTSALYYGLNIGYSFGGSAN